MAKLQMLSFEDDGIVAQCIKKESNYCDVAHCMYPLTPRKRAAETDQLAGLGICWRICH